ncbi:MAG TPA: hypothetical protein VG889_05670 [Rhizomicrobium sp.]|nr:hypothetical protein [Rhizomicrobium sp.]
MLRAPFDLSLARKVLFAAEIVDAVTLQPVTSGIRVSATGLGRRPIVNYDGVFVWLEEGANQPLQVIVDARDTAYESVAVPAPILPARSVRIELAPAYAYPFPPGATALRGRLIESPLGDPVAVAGAEVHLQWIDDPQPGTVWADSPVRSHSAANGDFAALMRFTPSQAPRALGKGIAARLSVTRGPDTRVSNPFTLDLGRIGGGPFAWSDLTP